MLYKTFAARLAIFVSMIGHANAAPIFYPLYFATDDITPHPIEITGSFYYDPSSAIFSQFSVTWTHRATIQNPYTAVPDPLAIVQTDVFDLTNFANSGLSVFLDTPHIPLGLTGTGADSFSLLSKALPFDVSGPDGTLRQYVFGAGRQPGLGSLLGTGSALFDAQYCAQTCGEILFGTTPSAFLTNFFTTTASPFGTADPNLMIEWTGDAIFSLSPIETTPDSERIPEPITCTTFGIGLVGAIAARRRKKRA